MVALPRCAAPHTPIRHDLGMSSAHPDPDAVMHTSTSTRHCRCMQSWWWQASTESEGWPPGAKRSRRRTSSRRNFLPVAFRGGAVVSGTNFAASTCQVCVCVCVCVCVPQPAGESNHVCSRSFITHSDLSLHACLQGRSIGFRVFSRHHLCKHICECMACRVQVCVPSLTCVCICAQQTNRAGILRQS